MNEDYEIELIMDKLDRMKETYDLSLELVDVTYTLVDSITTYCREHNISIYEEQGIWNLIKKSRHLFRLIEEVNSDSFKSPKLPPRKIHKRSPEDLPEPENLSQNI